uniref:Ubiquitin carboxyl-terminal hydrolase n=1 Tax=Davidia involucrata TaxID=16924 RepID=A0A5B7AVI3_DAVIN
MDTHLTKSTETEFPSSDLVDFQQTLDGSAPNSPPRTQTLDDLPHSSSVHMESNPNSSSNLDNLSPCSDSALLLDVEYQEGEEEADTLLYSPVNTFSAHSSSHWAEPCSSAAATESSTLNWSEPWPSAGDTKPSASDWSESWSSYTESEIKPSVSASPVRICEIKPSVVGAGLANLGNTCFLNAVLQCFTHTVPLVQGLRSCDHAMPCDGNSEGFCVLCALRSHIELSLASTGGVVAPLNLVNNLSYFSSSFRRFQQEDAHEFLQCLLDRLDSCCIDSKTKDTTLSSQDNNFVKQVFGGRLISKLRCCNCGHCSDTYEPLIDLSLEVEDVDTLSSALQSFTKVEKIEDSETKFTCENCKEEVSVEKQLMLDQVPSVAAFHLKRFKNDGSYVEKIDKHVKFPLELDLLPYTDSSQNDNVDLKYSLHAIVVHIGFSSTSGHYYCFVRSAPDIWHRLDDSKVTRVREDFVLSQEAYILFYAKEGTPWFSSFMETQKPLSDLNMSNTSPKSVLDNVDHRGTSSPGVVNSHSHEINETRDAADGIFTESSNGSRHERVEVNEAVDDSPRIYTPMPVGESNSCEGISCKVEKMCTPSPLGENNCNRESVEIKNNANITPQMPPRSPSPDIYTEEPPEVVYNIPRGHLPRSKNKASCKRLLNKDLEDPQRKQAYKVLRAMPSLRGSQLMAAMGGSHSEGSLNKKRTRMTDLSSKRDDSPSSARQRPNLSSVIRPVAAGNIR